LRPGLGLDAIFYGLGTYGFGLGSPGLENCTDNFTALPLNARKVIKLTVGIITN